MRPAHRLILLLIALLALATLVFAILQLVGSARSDGGRREAPSSVEACAM